MLRTASWFVVLILALAGAHTIDAAPAPAASSAPVAECTKDSPSEPLSRIKDDIAGCFVIQTSPRRVGIAVSYTYASPLGDRGIWMGIDVLAGGNRLKWFGYRPAAITRSTGGVNIDIVYGQNSPPAQPIGTDQVELFMYVGGGQIFYRKMFALKHEWKL